MADFMRRLRRIERVFRSERTLRDRSNPLEVFSADEIYARYRFRPESIVQLLDIVMPFIETPTLRSSPLPPLLCLLVALQFYATGTHHIIIADLHQISRASVVRAIRKVSVGLSRLVDTFVKFDDFTQTKTRFFNIARFPNVLGCVDCTQERVIRPKFNEADYINRKGYPALNIQMVCDAQFRVTNLVAKWPGSVHDSRIFRQSSLCQKFTTGEYDGLLLGDSGYQCTPYLMTPYSNPQSVAQERFNKSLCRTRVLIEQTFGILKRRFPCLKYGLRMEPERACKVVAACVVLHNFGIDSGDIITSNDCPCDFDQERVSDLDIDATGTAMRNYITYTYFG